MGTRVQKPKDEGVSVGAESLPRDGCNQADDDDGKERGSNCYSMSSQ